jgi:hypothetical protein
MRHPAVRRREPPVGDFAKTSGSAGRTARAPWPTAPLGRAGAPSGDQAMMSKCAKAAVFSTKRRRNSAAVIEPAKPPRGELSRSAMSGSISLS